MRLIDTSFKSTIDWSRSHYAAARLQCLNFEEASQYWAKAIYEEFVENNQQVFALVRIYRLCTFEELTPDLQAIVNPRDEEWMTLMGTVGEETAWCSRHESNKHKVVPVIGSPMFEAAFQQLGLGGHSGQGGGKLMVGEGTIVRYFHIPIALGSPYVPGQKDFVEPYGIESVIGCGSPFNGGSLCLVLGFSKVPIDDVEAQDFAKIAPHLTTSLAFFSDHKCIWK